MLKFMVIVVIAFAHGKKRDEPGVARGTFGGIGLSTEDMAGAVDHECAVLQEDDPSDASYQESAKRATPAIP